MNEQDMIDLFWQRSERAFILQEDCLEPSKEQGGCGGMPQ